MFAGALLRADESPRSGLLVRSARPEDLEMSAEGFDDYITPIDRFFVRSHVYVPIRPATPHPRSVGSRDPEDGRLGRQSDRR